YIYNVGMGRGLSVLELIQAFERATGRKVPYRIGDRRAGDIEQIWADTSYGEQELQWHAEIPIEESLRRAWHWQEALDKRDKTTN
ncbi:MAG: UDP-glucose 4-epimerase GalE, partial [Porphyromonas sp.]